MTFKMQQKLYEAENFIESVTCICFFALTLVINDWLSQTELKTSKNLMKNASS